ncbi:MAG: hypothetical protein V4462_05495, partial [Pseudomonadota bacterium]
MADAEKAPPSRARGGAESARPRAPRGYKKTRRRGAGLAVWPAAARGGAGRFLIPVQRAAGLVFGDAGLEEVALLLQVDHLA